MKRPFLLTFPPLLSALLLPMAYAEAKIIEADSAYAMSGNDSKIDACRIAMQEVKRKALELAGTYVESLTEVENYELMTFRYMKRCGRTVQYLHKFIKDGSSNRFPK